MRGMKLMGSMEGAGRSAALQFELRAAAHESAGERGPVPGPTHPPQRPRLLESSLDLLERAIDAVRLFIRFESK